MEKLGQILKQAAFSTYELLYILWNKTNEIIENKADVNGDFRGTWNGVEMHLSDEGLASDFNAAKGTYGSVAERLNTIEPRVSFLDFIKLQFIYGAVGDGVTDDTAALQNYINAVGNNGGGVVYIPQGKKYKYTTLLINKPNITLTGGGTLYNGVLTIGDNVVRELNFDIANIVFEFSQITVGKNAIELQNAKRGRIYNCRFINADKSIYFKPLNASQHCNRILIYNNVFQVANYCLYVDRVLNPDFTFGVGDLHFINNQAYGGINKSHIYCTGIDGIVIKGNTLFFTGYTSLDQVKEYNIFLDYCNWVVINGNNLFEAGLNSICLSHFQNCNVHGNNIAWAGQKAGSSAILCKNGDTAGLQYNLSVINSNNIQSPSKHGIEVLDNCGSIAISNNQIAKAGDTTYYYGSAVAGTKYAVYTDVNTSFINAANNNSFNNSIKLQGANSLENNNLKGDGVSAYTNTTLTVSDTSTDINVKGVDAVNLSQPSATTVATISGGIGGQVITLCAFNGNTTVSSAVGRLKGGVNAVIPLNGTLTLKYLSSKWQEIGRNF